MHVLSKCILSVCTYLASTSLEIEVKFVYVQEDIEHVFVVYFFGECLVHSIRKWVITKDVFG